MLRNRSKGFDFAGAVDAAGRPRGRPAAGQRARTRAQVDEDDIHFDRHRNGPPDPQRTPPPPPPPPPPQGPALATAADIAAIRTTLAGLETIVTNLSTNLTSNMTLLDGRLLSIESRGDSHGGNLGGELVPLPADRFACLDEAIITQAMEGRLPSDQLHRLLDPNSPFLSPAHKDLLAKGDDIEVVMGEVNFTLPQAKTGLKGTLHATTMKKIVSTPTIFLSCWLTMIELWSSNAGEDGSAMLAALANYGRQVVEWSATREWQSILSYHIAFAASRLKGQFRFSDWYSALDNVLFQQHVRRHVVAPTTAAAAPRKQAGLPVPRTAPNTASAVCIRWQNGNCSSYPCRYTHACMLCGGNHQQRNHAAAAVDAAL
jgi:hypothetical protein